MIQIVVPAVLLACLYWPVIQRLISVWQTDGDWSHGFVVPFFGLYYLYVRRDRLPTGVEQGGWMARAVGAALLILSYVVYVKVTFLSPMDYPKSLALVMSIFGTILLIGGWPVTRWSWFAVAFLLFAMPLPQTMYQDLTLPLRILAAKVSATALSAIPDMVTEAAGTVVQYSYKGQPAGTLDIERACSGMRLLMTMTALGVAMTFVSDRPLWQRAIMIPACIPIAVFCNVIRVTTTGFFVVSGRDELARGTWHMLLGLAMLVIAFGLYGAMSYILNNLFVEGGAEPTDSTVSQGVTG